MRQCYGNRLVARSTVGFSTYARLQTAPDQCLAVFACRRFVPSSHARSNSAANPHGIRHASAAEGLAAGAHSRLVENFFSAGRIFFETISNCTEFLFRSDEERVA